MERLQTLHISQEKGVFKTNYKCDKLQRTHNKSDPLYLRGSYLKQITSMERLQMFHDCTAKIKIKND